MAKRQPRGQRHLEGMEPAGMKAARAALSATDRPVYGPQRPPGDLSAITGRAAHFNIGSMESRHTFEVDWSRDKDTLKSGELRSGTSRLTVQGKDETDARLLAEQMVAARGHEPTKVRWIP